MLSVETALSIQSHPDKALAQRLHAERPQVPPQTQSLSQLCQAPKHLFFNEWMMDKMS